VRNFLIFTAFKRKCVAVSCELAVEVQDALSCVYITNLYPVEGGWGGGQRGKGGW